MKVIENGVCAAIGFKAGSIHCGIRKNQTKDDLALIVLGYNLSNGGRIHKE